MSLLLQSPSRALVSRSPPVFAGGKPGANASQCLRCFGKRRHEDGVARFRRAFCWMKGGAGQNWNLGLGLGGGGGGVCSGAFQQAHCVRREFVSLNCSNISRVSNGDKKWGRRVRCSLGISKLPSSSSSHQRRTHRQGRIYARGEHRGIISRKVKVGLLYKLVRHGGGGGVDGGGGNNGHGSGGGGTGGGGDGGDGLNLPNSDDGNFNFFSGLLNLLRERCKSRIWAWAAPAFLVGFLVSSLDWRDCAHAKTYSTSEALTDGPEGVEAPGEKEGEKDKTRAKAAVWEIKGSTWRRFAVDLERDEFRFDVVKPSKEEAEGYEQCFENKEGNEEQKRDWVLSLPGHGRSLAVSLQDAGVWASELVRQVFLPAGFPGSVTEGYMEFTSWRMGQVIASQISGVLTTQALLYAVGLGKGAIPTAAAVNWVLRDGIGYLSKILLSKYGRHFDVHPKGWRLVSDLIENASYGLELVTPVVPHLFVYLAAAAGAGRSAAGLIQAATKSTFNANFAAQRNFAEIIAKGEAQGMASKSVGIGLGILISGYVGSQGPLLVVTFGAVSALHIFFNLKSYQAVHLRTLNPYRASLVLAEYLKSGNVPTIRDVNAEEPIFFGVPWFDPKPKRDQGKLDTVSPQSKSVASAFQKNVELGVSLGVVVHTKGEADAMIVLYSEDNYLLAVQGGNHIKVVLKGGASPQDMLRAMVQAVYLLNLSNDRHIHSGNLIMDCSTGGILQVTHDLMEKNFESITSVLSGAGWVSDGVLARAAPNRLFEN